MNWTWPDAKGTIAAILVIAMVVLIVVLFEYPAALDGHPAILGVLQMVVGALIASINTVISFYFGSSQGSKEKDDVIGKIATTVTKP